LLEELGRELAERHGVQHRVVEVDCYRPELIDTLSEATAELDVGLVVSNAGTGEPGEFLKHDRHFLLKIARLNALSHLEIAHYFGERLARRGRGGLLLGGAMGALHGLPFMAGDSASKAFVQTLGEALHVEFKPLGVNVTVLVTGPTDTAIIPKFGLDPRTMPMKPMSVEQCVCEGLAALAQNRATHIPGRANRVINAIMPASVARRMMGKMLREASVKEGSGRGFEWKGVP
jgi:short-subunit dehydrogenase